jgi:hypothetical protein
MRKNGLLSCLSPRQQLAAEVSGLRVGVAAAAITREHIRLADAGLALSCREVSRPSVSVGVRVRSFLRRCIFFSLSLYEKIRTV